MTLFIRKMLASNSIPHEFYFTTETFQIDVLWLRAKLVQVNAVVKVILIIYMK